MAGRLSPSWLIRELSFGVSINSDASDFSVWLVAASESPRHSTNSKNDRIYAVHLNHQATEASQIPSLSQRGGQ